MLQTSQGQDIWEMIASHLSPHDLARLSAVSKHGHLVAHSLHAVHRAVARMLANGTIVLCATYARMHDRASEWVPDATAATLVGVRAWPHITFSAVVGLPTSGPPAAHGMWNLGHNSQAGGHASPSTAPPAWMVDHGVLLIMEPREFTESDPFQQAIRRLSAQMGDDDDNGEARSWLMVRDMGYSLVPLAAFCLKHWGMPHALTLQCCKQLVDVSAFAAIHTLDLRACINLEDVACLGHVHNLTLSQCDGVVHVAALGRVSLLNLSYCRNLADVTGLVGVRKLNLAHCRKVIDVSTLGGCDDLNLCGCTGVVEVGALGGVRKLNLGMCTSVVDVSLLTHVVSLNLWGCTGVRDVSKLGNVCSLNLSMCRSIRSVAALGSVHTLNLCNMADRVLHVAALGNIHTLDLSCSSTIHDVSTFSNTHTLNLSRCKNVADVSPLASVVVLDLSHCEGVLDVSMLGRVKCLNLAHCVGVGDVRALGDVPTLNLSGEAVGARARLPQPPSVHVSCHLHTSVDTYLYMLHAASAPSTTPSALKAQ